MGVGEGGGGGVAKCGWERGGRVTVLFLFQWDRGFSVLRALTFQRKGIELGWVYI